jgi:hypothetical protein
MPLPTLAGKTHPDVKRAITQLADQVNTHEATIAELHKKLAAIPAPMTLAQIAAGLSSTGSNPLNLTGLIGTPAPTP